MKVQHPLCPRCGCPPRFVIGTFQVRVGVRADKDNDLSPTGEKRVGKRVEAPMILECGGGHLWPSTELPST